MVKKYLIFIFLMIICISFSLNNFILGRSTQEKITLWIEIHEIVMVDQIENPPEAEWIDWHFYLTVKCDGQSFNEEAVLNKCGYEKIVDNVYKFEIYGRHVRINMDLFDEDMYSRPDLADISSHPGGGMDNYDEITLGTRFSAVYDARNNMLMDNDDVTLESGFYVTSGEYDGSDSVDENDAEIWFRVWDDYDIPKAEAGPDRYCYTGKKFSLDGAGSTASNASNIVEYEWDFDGDGEFEVKGAEPSYTFSTRGQYDVTLRVWDSFGEADVDTCKINVGDSPPSTSFTFSPERPNLLSPVRFFDASKDDDGYIRSWLWHFGDGQNSTEQAPTHTYRCKGTYTVVLTVTDNSGELNASSVDVNVVNLPPTADFSFYPKEPVMGDVVHFRDASNDPDGGIFEIEWDFGDGYTSNDQNPIHSYRDAGVYSVRLVAEDEEGEVNAVTKILRVLQKHDMVLIVKDILGLTLSNAEIKVYSNDECVASGATDEKGILLLSEMPEGLYEIRVNNLGMTTSKFCPLTNSATVQILTPLSYYTLGSAGCLTVFVPILIVYLIKRK